MNHAILGSAGTLTVVVDWVEPARPLDSSIDALRDWLVRESARPRERIDVHRGHAVERAKAASTERSIAETVVKEAAPPGGAFVYVLYWDRFDRYRGVTFPSDELDSRAPFPVVVMLADSIRHDCHLWLTRKKVERAVLVHEFGHVAGLVSSGRRVHDGHCPNPRCRMYHGPDWPAIKANAFPVLCLWKLPLDFCDDCERELREGR